MPTPDPTRPPIAIHIDDGKDWRSVEVIDWGTGEKIGDLVGGHAVMPDGSERRIEANTEGRWSPSDPGPAYALGTDGAVTVLSPVGGTRIDAGGVTTIPAAMLVGYTALLLPLRSEFPAPILPEPPITDAEWSAMIEVIRASAEDVIALPIPASCTDDASLRACAEALRVTACALGIGLVFYPRFEETRRDRSGKVPRNEVVLAALMVRRLS